MLEDLNPQEFQDNLTKDGNILIDVREKWELDICKIEESVCSIVENYVGKLHKNQVSIKNSSKGKYVSITIRIIATSRQQLDSINADLQKSPLVSYLL